MNVMDLRYYSPPPQKLSLRQALDTLVRMGFRPYLCGDPGYGIVIAWASTIYKEVDCSGEVGFEPELHGGELIPTYGLVPDIEATIARVSAAIDCESVKPSRIEPALEHLLSSSVMVVGPDDWGNLRVKTVI